jgi:hemolysin III
LPLVAATGVVIVALAPGGATRTSLLAYALCASALFATSTAHHLSRLDGWPGRMLQRLDHASIFLIIAGTYTPFVVVALGGATGTAFLVIVWSAALGGVVLRLAWPGAPRWLAVGLYVSLGWSAAFVFPQLLDGAGIAAVVLALVGGGLYTVGALVYALRRPDPLPSTLGFHEVFHLFTVAAFVCLDVAVWLTVFGPH